MRRSLAMLELAWEMLELAKNGTTDYGNLENGEMNGNNNNSDSNWASKR